MTQTWALLFSLAPGFSRLLFIFSDFTGIIITVSRTFPDSPCGLRPRHDSLGIFQFPLQRLPIWNYLFICMIGAYLSPPLNRKPNKGPQRSFLCCRLLRYQHINIFVQWIHEQEEEMMPGIPSAPDGGEGTSLHGPPVQHA